MLKRGIRATKRNQDMIEFIQEQADEIEQLQRKLKQYVQDFDDHSKHSELL